jgi:hypothetical protein
MMNVSNLNYDMQSNQTIELLRTIGSPLIGKKEPFVSGVESLELYDLAVKNKITLLYLVSLKQQGKLNKLKKIYDAEHAKYLKFLDSIVKASKILDAADIEYVIFKTIRPYPAVPGDVDVLLMGTTATYVKTNELFLQAGYKEWISEGVSPTLPDLIDPGGGIVVDLQDELEVSYVIYMDKNKFRGHIFKRGILPEVEIKTLTPEYDLATTIMHSQTHNLYLLGEFYTLLYVLSGMNEREIDDFVAVLTENKITAAAKSFVTITSVLHKAAYGIIPEKLEYVRGELGYEKLEAKRLVKSDFKMPHRYDISTLIKVILEKMWEKRFRMSVGMQMVKMLMNPRLIMFMIVEVFEMRRKKYYLKDVEKIF